MLAKTAPDLAIQIQMIWLFKEVQSIGATFIEKNAPVTCPGNTNKDTNINTNQLEPLCLQKPPQTHALEIQIKIQIQIQINCSH